MFKYLLSSYEFMEIWSIVTMVIFFVAFTFVIIYTVKMSKKDVEYMSLLPIDDKSEK